MHYILRHYLSQLFIQESLKDESFSFYLNVPANTIPTVETNINIDLVITKDSFISSYLKIVRGSSLGFPSFIPNKPQLDLSIPLRYYLDLIQNTTLDTIPHLIDTIETYRDSFPTVTKFVNDYCNEHTSNQSLELEIYDETRVLTDFPNLCFKDFLLDQFLIDRKDNITLFGQAMGLLKKYHYDSISDTFIYDFVITKEQYSKLSKLIHFSLQDTFSFPEKVEMLHSFEGIQINDIQNSLDAAKETKLKDLFKKDPDTLQFILSNVHSFSDKEPTTYQELATMIDKMYASSIYRSGATYAIRAIAHFFHSCAIS